MKMLADGIMLSGAVFMLLAAIGAVRMPDLLTRMHATTKAGAFGAGLMLVGVSMEFTELSMMVRALVILLFILLTSPVAAHAIGHAGYVTGARLWEGTLKDDLKRQAARPEAAGADARSARPASAGEPPAT
jgi:multicomponent Na+:H+ antiporter subunit G